jgi:putative tricarboxylic transport membrane protein
MLVILNLPLIGLWVRLLTVPYRLLYPSILAFMGIGVYGTSNSPFDVLLMAFWGIMGIVFVKLECEPAPLLLGVVLGPMLEENLRRALMITHGDPIIFISRPISVAFLIAAFLLLIVILAPTIRMKREEVFVKD